VRAAVRGEPNHADSHVNLARTLVVQVTRLVLKPNIWST